MNGGGGGGGGTLENRITQLLVLSIHVNCSNFTYLSSGKRIRPLIAESAEPSQGLFEYAIAYKVQPSDQTSVLSSIWQSDETLNSSGELLGIERRQVRINYAECVLMRYFINEVARVNCNDLENYKGVRIGNTLIININDQLAWVLFHYKKVTTIILNNIFLFMVKLYINSVVWNTILGN